MLMQAVENYLAVRRSVGFKLVKAEQYLRSFASFAADRGDSYVVSGSAIAWASQAKSEAHRDSRLKAVIRFARFIRAEDGRHEIPPDGVFCGQRNRPTPYIFSDEEIRELVLQASRLGPFGSLRPHTYSTLFALMAVAGLRVSETLNLKLKDFTTDGLIIRETKCRKSRLVPLHKSSVAALKRYIKKRRKVAGNDEHLFVSSRGLGFGRTIVAVTFQKVLKAAGITRHPELSSVRLMDLRHSFAVRALERCPDDRENTRRHMLALTTYMGHAKLASTYWYLESTPELMSNIAGATEAFFAGGAS